MEQTTAAARDEATISDNAPPPSLEEKKEDCNNNKNTEHHKDNHAGKKRKRGNNDHYGKAYENTHYEIIPPNPQELCIPAGRGPAYTVHTSTTPGAPLRQFKHSFRFRLGSHQEQILHQHANGLCVVTAGDTTHQEEIERIEFVVQVADACSANERRKKQSKMLRGKNQETNNNNGMVTPSTEIARIHFSNNNQPRFVYAGVWGSLLELNESLTPQQLQKDPVMEGYLAVILPTGPFPPRSQQTTIEKQENNDQITEDTKEE